MEKNEDSFMLSETIKGIIPQVEVMTRCSVETGIKCLKQTHTEKTIVVVMSNSNNSSDIEQCY